jgi:hypothetical protein
MTMATKTTLSKPEYFMPSKFGVDTSNTKARRAWLAAKVEELTAQGYVCKIVDQGSYQHISARKPVEVEGRLQLRGTCQACGAVQAVTDGRGAKHGYRVIDRGLGGYFAGTCHGAGQAPAEHSIAYATDFREQLLASADRIEAALPAAEASAKTAVRPSVPQPLTLTDYRTGRRSLVDPTPENEAAWKLWREYAALINAPVEMKREMNACRRHAEHLKTNVFPRLGQPLYETVVA